MEVLRCVRLESRTEREIEALVSKQQWEHEVNGVGMVAYLEATLVLISQCQRRIKQSKNLRR